MAEPKPRDNQEHVDEQDRDEVQRSRPPAPREPVEEVGQGEVEDDDRFQATDN